MKIRQFFLILLPMLFFTQNALLAQDSEQEIINFNRDYTHEISFDGFKNYEDTQSSLDTIFNKYKQKLCDQEATKADIRTLIDALIDKYIEWLKEKAQTSITDRKTLLKSFLEEQPGDDIQTLDFTFKKACNDTHDIVLKFSWDDIKAKMYTAATEQYYRFAIMFAPNNTKYEKLDIVMQYNQGEDYFWESDCADHDIFRNISDNSVIAKTANNLFGTDDDYFIDMPYNDRQQNVFPGVLIRDPDTPHNIIVSFDKLSDAIDAKKEFQRAVKQNSACSQMKVHVIQISPDYWEEPGRWGQRHFRTGYFGYVGYVIIMD